MVKNFFCVDENCLEWSKQQKGGGGSESNIIITVINKDDRSFFLQKLEQNVGKCPGDRS